LTQKRTISINLLFNLLLSLLRRLRRVPIQYLLVILAAVIFQTPLRYTVTRAIINALPDPIAHLLGMPVNIAPLFTNEVAYWDNDIKRWAAEYGLDSNLLATVMQIESCGHPTISSYAGAQGLFQVMPFHFDAGENQLDPDTNARRGASFLKQCIGWANGSFGLALACYNGGPSVLQQSHSQWSDQTKRYYTWGIGIYADAVTDKPYSDTLARWLEAGGKNLCNQAATVLGLPKSFG
jgi:soluble lytic murein transglycosylase-like protein